MHNCTPMINYARKGLISIDEVTKKAFPRERKGK